MNTTPIELEVFIESRELGLEVVPHLVKLAASLFLPASDLGIPATLVVAHPGGASRRDYYHRAIAGVGSYSAANFLTDYGVCVLTVDHLGTGESSGRETGLPGLALTPHVLAHANALCVETVLTHWHEGTLSALLVETQPDLGAKRAQLDLLRPQRPFTVGLGHSMGAFLCLIQQAGWHSFDALALAGWSNAPLQLAGVAEQMQESHPELDVAEDAAGAELVAATTQLVDAQGYFQARSLFATFFYADDVPSVVILDDERRSTVVPLAILQAVGVEGAAAEAAAQITIPLFLLFGEAMDVSPDPRREHEYYPHVSHFTCYLQPGSGHCHFLDNRRELGWFALLRWIWAVAPRRRLAGGMFTPFPPSETNGQSPFAAPTAMRETNT